MHMTQGLHRSLQQRPDAPATIFGDRRRTVGEQAARVARVASALGDLGVGDGERVGVLALNSDRFAELLLAVPWANGVLNLVNVRWVPALTDRHRDLRTVVYLGEAEQPPQGMLGYEDLVADYPPRDDARRGGDAV